MLIINPHLKIPLREFKFTFARSSGPGGQNVNKLNTKALLRWPITKSQSLPISVQLRLVEKYKRRITSSGDLLITSQRFRDAGRNVADCLEKLRAMLHDASIVPKVRKPTKRSKQSKQRRLDDKRKQSQKKQSRRPPESS